MSNTKTAELPRLGGTLRKLRLERGLELADVAAELDVPAKSLRAVEWDRSDLLRGNGADELIERRYAAFLGLEVAGPAVVEEPVVLPKPAAAREPAEPAGAEAPRPSRDVSAREWLALLAALGPPFAIALPFFLEDAPVHTLGLVFVSSLLLFAAALPQGVLAHARVSSATFARCREPLGLAGLGILLPVALFSALGALT